MPTIRDVAVLAGVGVSTVSRVIRSEGYVSAAVRERVRGAMRQLEYSPNSAAQALRGRRTSTVALLVPELHRPFWTGLIHGAELTADERGYSLVVASWRNDPERERRSIERLLSRNVDGLLLFSQDRRHERIGLLKAAGTPCVMLGIGAGDFPADRVYVDTQTAAHRLTTHLIDHGHTRIAAIHGPQSAGGARQRRAGYERALTDRGLPLDPLLMRSAESSNRAGYLACLDLLRQENPPTGLLTANAYQALGALYACREVGVRVPEDIAIVTVDDIEMDADLSLFVTAATQPTQTMGRVAVQMLLDRIENVAIAGFRDVVLKAEIIIRQSCGCHAPPDVFPREEVERDEADQTQQFFWNA